MYMHMYGFLHFPHSKPQCTCEVFSCKKATSSSFRISLTIFRGGGSHWPVSLFGRRALLTTSCIVYNNSVFIRPPTTGANKHVSVFFNAINIFAALPQLLKDNSYCSSHVLWCTNSTSLAHHFDTSSGRSTCNGKCCVSSQKYLI